MKTRSGKLITLVFLLLTTSCQPKPEEKAEQDLYQVPTAELPTAKPYAPINVTRFVGNANTVPDVASPPTPTPKIIPACTPANTTETSYEELEKARSALVNFFDLLNHQEYERAAALYGGEYQGLRYDPITDTRDPATLLSNGCEIHGFKCLRVKRIVEEKAVSLIEYHFIIEFLNQDGSLFVRGPCCGANATDMPSESQFSYTVVRNCTGEFLVAELPVYVP